MPRAVTDSRDSNIHRRILGYPDHVSTLVRWGGEFIHQ